MLCTGMAALCLLTSLPAGADYSTEALDKVVRGYSRDCMVLLATADGDVIYTYQPDKMIYGASLIKLAYAVYACQQLDAGVHSLDETMTYTSSWYHGGSGIIRKNGYGKSYTIRQLLDYSLRYSDNVAYDMLIYLFGEDGFNDMLAAWGYPQIHISKAETHFPSVNVRFMRRSMMEMQQHSHEGECWETCWTALVNSTEIKMRQYLTDGDVDAAVKFGQISSVYHEACYVDDTTPYVLVVLTSITSNTPNTTFLKNVAVAARSLIGDFAASDLMPGDVDFTNTIDASDAACVLNASAVFGAMGTQTLGPRQQQAADLNADGICNASDAALILQYAAHAGAGGTDDLLTFLDARQPEEPTEEPTEMPTEEPTEMPTEIPTEEPTEEAAVEPTEAVQEATQQDLT